METDMNIGQAAKASGVSAKMLRYYEAIGLIPRAGRTNAGYRVYSDADVNTLRFVRRARNLGLPIERIRLLVGLWRDKGRSSGEVKRIALEHAAELRAKVAELTGMLAALEELAEACHGDHRPECPILRDLERGGRRPSPSDGNAVLRRNTVRRHRVDSGQAGGAPRRRLGAIAAGAAR
jgi:MerR family copper efflux transcriptional regulator